MLEMVGRRKSRSTRQTLFFKPCPASARVRDAAVLMDYVVFPIPPLGPMIEMIAI